MRDHRPTGLSYTYQNAQHTSFRVGRYRGPPGYSYVHYGTGATFPRPLWLSRYYLTNYLLFGLDPPYAPSLAWIRNGPDLLLVDQNTGVVEDEIDDFFEEADDVNVVSLNDQTDDSDDGTGDPN